ncbi:hypothetical protein DT076_00435 [Desertihabitans brevis]|uniref:Uncharacterized protein n=1 Tax=Desertihabitans brevis TaxID=2268447 RepID=A0A367YYK0_9ACTN|nr:DUF5682 family protein [Desertihabitans brevis]RCK70993.1 hypothetical protein DT076_00435 [Desertihabitans brevis]
MPGDAGAPTPEVAVLGVRHHGPGSARSVLLALTELQPDSVLVEGVPELDPVLPLLAADGMRPPVAGLVHGVEQRGRALFYPMASFSPEWVALRWALANAVPARMADLAATHVLALEDTGAEEPDALRARPDAIGTLAAAAGYDDPERWWEDAVEHRSTSSLARFASITEAMAAVREGHDPVAAALDDEASGWTVQNARREAAMRQAVRAEWKAGRPRVAFVCGAYHAPAVDPTGRPAAPDTRLLTKLPRVKVAATWVPWTTGRLARSSGYGAGITSPGWYQHLFDSWQDGDAVGEDAASTSWLVRTAQALRAEGLDAAPASVVEAVRLARTLAVVRGRPSVGLEEVLDATQTVLCGGSAVPLRLVGERLVVGHRLGEVPEDTPMAPVAADLARQQKTLRLRVSAEEKVVELDLRREAARGRSVLFHRLGVLDVDWATRVRDEAGLGTFKETWSLTWRPELAVTLVEAGLYGTTVREAAAGRLAERARDADGLDALAGLVERCLLAELDEALPTVLTRLDEQAAHHTDVVGLLRSVEPMARTCRYGDVRALDVARVADVLLTVVRRASVGLRAACSALDDEAAARMVAAMEATDAGIGLLGTEELLGPWQQALAAVAADDRVHGTVVGRANRMLLDVGVLDAEEVARRVSRWLSGGTDPLAAAGFVDGLLTGDALLLLHEPTLLRLLDGWLRSVGGESFDALLPLLRRTFAAFSAAERRSIGETLRSGGTPRSQTAEIDLDRARPAVAAFARLLGLTDPATEEVP